MGRKWTEDSHLFRTFLLATNCDKLSEVLLPATEADGVADAMIKARQGFDHGVGHPLLLLYDTKAPHGQKSKEFKGLGDYLPNAALSTI